MQELTATLHAGSHSLAVRSGSAVRTFDGRGVIDLYRLLTADPRLLQGALVADKVVGKGAAALMSLGGVRALHADVISQAALALFAAEGRTEVTYDCLVPHIANRAGTGICPVETLCAPCTTAAECLPHITRFLQTLSSKTEKA